MRALDAHTLRNTFFNFRKILGGFLPESIKNLMTTHCLIFKSITSHDARNGCSWLKKFVKNLTNVLWQQKNMVECLQSVHSRQCTVACAVLPRDLKKRKSRYLIVIPRILDMGYHHSLLYLSNHEVRTAMLHFSWCIRHGVYKNAMLQLIYYKGASTSVRKREQGMRDRGECERMPKSCLFSVRHTSEQASVPLVIRRLHKWV